MREVLDKIKRHSGLEKPMNPHAFRHSRLTELAKYLADSKLKLFAGWSQHSRMASTYVHLCGKDLDDDLLFAAGVEPEKAKPKDSPLKVKNCPRCNSKNSSVSEFCSQCGYILNDKAQAQMVKEEMNTQELKEKYEVAVEGIEAMIDRISELEKQVETLQSY